MKSDNMSKDERVEIVEAQIEKAKDNGNDSIIPVLFKEKLAIYGEKECDEILNKEK